MPSFKFRFVDAGGTTHEGVAEADDQDSLVYELRTRGAILEIVELPSAADEKKQAGTTSFQFRLDFGLSKEDLALYTRQLATMLSAGLPVMKILAILRKRCASPSFARVLDSINSEIQGGTRFSDALAKHPSIFDGMYVNLVKVGEAGGKLSEMVQRLADLLDKDAALQRKVKSAMAYPAFILLFTVVLSYTIVAFLMPLFTPMFLSSGLNIPQDYPLTHMLMKISYLANNPILIVVVFLGIGAAGFTIRSMSKTRAGRLALDQVVFYVPIINTVFRYAAVARFARTLSTLMESGLPILQALTLVAGASDNAVLARAVDRVANQISKGRRISDAIDSEAGIFPDLLIQMVQVGEESGALGQMLERCADYYDSQMDASVQRLVAVMEPGMMVVVGGIVCGFVLAVLLPILGLAKVG